MVERVGKKGRLWAREGKKMAGDDEAKVVQNHRPSLKTPPSFNNCPKWKSKLRENCFRRVREDRNRLLWKLRLPDVKPQSSNNKDLINSTLQGIVSEELRKIKGLSLDEGSAPAPCKATEDMIWEYDGLQTAYEGDCEEILLEMQRIFYEDIGRGESTKGIFYLRLTFRSLQSLKILSQHGRMKKTNIWLV